MLEALNRYTNMGRHHFFVRLASGGVQLKDAIFLQKSIFDWEIFTAPHHLIDSNICCIYYNIIILPSYDAIQFHYFLTNNLKMPLLFGNRD